MIRNKLSRNEFNLIVVEKNAIVNCLQYYMGNVKLSSEKLGVSRATLYRKLYSYGLCIESFREQVNS